MSAERPADELTSPYRSIRPVDASGVQSAFRKELADSLRPLLTEVVSQHTRQVQQQLLFIAAALLLLSFSVITITGEAAWNGVKLKVLANSAVAIAFAVTVYLELIVAVRSFLDWSAWRIQAGAAQLSLEKAAQYAFANSPSGSEASEVKFREGVDAAFDRHSDGEQPLADDELNRRAVQRSLEREQLKSQREETRANTAWIDSKVAPLRFVNTLRVAVELLFPVLFGGVALVVSAVRQL